jgi:hypothetical protein
MTNKRFILNVRDIGIATAAIGVVASFAHPLALLIAFPGFILILWALIFYFFAL